MEILHVNQRILKMLGMCSLADGRDFRSKLHQIAITILIMILLTLIEWSSALFCLEHYRIGDINSNLFAVIQFIGTLPAIASCISLVYRKSSVRDYFARIQSVFDQCNYTEIEFQLGPHFRVPNDAKYCSERNIFCENYFEKN